MQEYVLSAIIDSNYFSSNEIQMVQTNIEVITKIYQLGVIKTLNTCLSE